MKKEKIGLVTAVTQLVTAIILLIQALKDQQSGYSFEQPPLRGYYITSASRNGIVYKNSGINHYTGSVIYCIMEVMK